MSAYAQLNAPNPYAAAFTTIATAFNKTDTSAAYNNAYSSRVQRKNAFSDAANGGRRLAAIRTYKTLQISQLESQKLEAQAHATLSAAVSGTKGNSVDAVVQDMETSAANRAQAIEKEAKNSSASEAAAIFSAYSTGISTRRAEIPKVDYAKLIAGGMASSGAHFMKQGIDGTLPWQ